MARKFVIMGAVLAVCALTLVTCVSCSSDERFRRAATPTEKEQADALAHQMIQKLGGAAAWDALGGVSFDFIATFGGIQATSRHHDWDKQRGMHRLVMGEGDDRTVVYTDLWDRHAVVERNGTVLTGEEAQELADEAWGAYINDVYWLIAPYKVFDDGVQRAAVDGDLRLTFDDGVGLTSGDAYILDLDEDGTLRGWSFLLESGISGSFAFEGRQTQHGVTFFSRKVASVGEISFGTIDASADMATALFAPLHQHRSAGQ